jgi:hypothetical protein
VGTPRAAVERIVVIARGPGHEVGIDLMHAAARIDFDAVASAFARGEALHAQRRWHA